MHAWCKLGSFLADPKHKPIWRYNNSPPCVMTKWREEQIPLLTSFVRPKRKTDMIKGNESDVGNIDFVLQAYKEVTNSYVLHYFWTTENGHISATRYPIEIGFESKCSILNVKSDLYWKIKIKYCRHMTHSPSSCHNCVGLKWNFSCLVKILNVVHRKWKELLTIRPEIKRFVCPFGLKIGKVGRSIFFFFFFFFFSF